MRHITLFFCDINNTFLGSKKNNEEDIKKFIINLKNIKDKNKSQDLFFIFASEETPEEIKKIESYFSSFIIDSSLEIIKNIGKDDLKTMNIIYIIKEMHYKYYIDEVYFADDCDIYHEILKELLLTNNIDIKINSIITKYGGMVELNESLENFLKLVKVKNII